MSADNWTTCPKCQIEVEAKTWKRVKKANEAYGKVDAAEYLRLLNHANEPIPEELSLREDYELGMGADGIFSVGYSCSCRQCGFSFTFKHEEPAKI